MCDSDGANDAKAANASTLRDDQVGPPFRRRNARFGENGWVMPVSRLEKGVAVDSVIPLDPDFLLQLRKQPRRPRD